MTPAEFEALVATDYATRGYEVQDRPYRADWGVDVIATKGAERVCVQVKMYGGTTRSVNRAAIMELYGASAFFDCTLAVLATDGLVVADAVAVAAKLGVQIVEINGSDIAPSRPRRRSAPLPHVAHVSFDSIWERYIMPLEGTALTTPTGRTNRIVKVDWSGLARITSNGREQRIEIEIFRAVVNQLLTTGTITRAEINNLYPKRASSGIALILSQVPAFAYGGRPAVMRVRPDVSER
jgi:Holliday junction resolvase-like predicted endonuclease